VRLLILVLLLVGCTKAPERKPVEVPVVDTSSLDSFQAGTISNAVAAVRTQAESAEAWGKLGQAFEAAEFYGEAMRCYQRAVELDGSSGKWRYLLALRQLQEEPEVALTNLVEAVKRVPATNDAPRLRLAQALVERGRYYEAGLHLERLMSMDTNHAAARLELARIKVALGQLDVVEMLRPAVTNSYTARAAHLLLSQVWQRAGDEEEAAKWTRRAAGMPEAFDWPDAYLREVQSLMGADQALSERANALLVQGRFEEAERVLQQLVQRGPENPEPLLLLGRLRIQQRRCGEAEAFLQRHLALRTNSLQGYVQLGLARYCDSRWEAAAEAFRKATELKPDFAQAHYNLGLALARRGDNEGAKAAYQSALQINPADANAHAALAEEFLRAGDRARAEQHANDALRIDAKHAKALKVLQTVQPSR
jgi:tetratricopeptide (TPR) repeat protein